jgi:hypothetical protein
MLTYLTEWKHTGSREREREIRRKMEARCLGSLLLQEYVFACRPQAQYKDYISQVVPTPDQLDSRPTPAHTREGCCVEHDVRVPKSMRRLTGSTPTSRRFAPTSRRS